MDQHFGIAARVEAVAGTLELVHQLAVVVDLAVLYDDDRAVLVRDRLVAAGQVDDREPAGGDRNGAVEMRALGVGAAVVERRGHAPEPFGVDGAAAGRDPADPAHAASLEASCGIACSWGWLRPSRSFGAGAGHSGGYVQARTGRDAPRLSHQPRVRVHFTSSL